MLCLASENLGHGLGTLLLGDFYGFAPKKNDFDP